MKYYVIDAFTDTLFQGNPAGVCVLESALPDEMMQKIAFENNLAETAFVLKSEDAYHLRWFTPDVEMDLCGHATLATAFVLLNGQGAGSQVCFETKSGRLYVTKQDDLYTMDLPSRPPVPAPLPPLLEQALGCPVLEAYTSRDLLAVVEDERTVRDLHVDFPLLQQISNALDFSIIVTAKGESCDFVSRFFAPNAGVMEDPVTGSAHCTLIPFWSEKLHQTNLLAKQLSPRGGVLVCQDLGQRVSISGKAVSYLSGEIKLSY